MAGLFKSQINISDSLAPDAKRLDWKGLTSRERTAPVCWVMLAIIASELELHRKNRAFGC